MQLVSASFGAVLETAASGRRARHVLEVVPVDTGGFQLRRVLCLKSVHTGRMDKTTVGAWHFATLGEAQLYAIGRFGADPACIV
jgi:hypothetical protein